MVRIMYRPVCVLVRGRGSIYHLCLLYQIINIWVFSCELRELLLIILAGYLFELEAIPIISINLLEVMAMVMTAYVMVA